MTILLLIIIPMPFLFVLTSYRQCFDLEGEYGIVVRGIGTAVTLANALTAAGSSHPSTPVHALTSSGEVGPGSLISDSGCSDLLNIILL